MSSYYLEIAKWIQWFGKSSIQCFISQPHLQMEAIRLRGSLLNMQELKIFKTI